MTAEPRVILGLMMMVVILGAFAVYRYTLWADARARRLETEWERAFEPTRDAGIVVHPEDVLTERPLAPEEYRILAELDGILDRVLDTLEEGS